MRRFHKSPERTPSGLELMGGNEERTSEIGKARAEAEQREAQVRSRFDDTPPDTGAGRRRRHGGSRSQATRRPRRSQGQGRFDAE